MCSIPKDSVMAQDALNTLVRHTMETVTQYRNLRWWLQAPEGSIAETALAGFDKEVDALEASVKTAVAKMDKEVG